MHKAVIIAAAADACVSCGGRTRHPPAQALDTTSATTARAALAAAKPITAPHAMVVSAQHLATEVGGILKKGGNAVDAAVG